MEYSNWIYPKNFIQILLADKVAPSTAQTLEEEGYSVTTKYGQSKEEVDKRLQNGTHVIGIRSKTHLRAETLEKAEDLLAIGCYCIGTDQVDLEAAANFGIPVFNSPFGNTRSVAEMIISQIIQLARKAGDRNRECHQGVWGKTHIGCHEIRGKTLGVVGYGHVGTQVSILAEAMGMKVMYYDIIPKLPLGNAYPAASLDLLLPNVDFLTLHVPGTEKTENMINTETINKMRKGSYLLNAARGKCVILEDVADAIKSGQLAGAYFDVYPTEPLNKENNCLLGLPNVNLSPHIGGSTMEAQENIGKDCTNKIISFINEGATVGSVNFPECSLPPRPQCHRLINIHRNVPGVLRHINDILCDYNVAAQILSTKGTIGYLIVDIDSNKQLSVVVKEKLDQLEESIKTRVIWKKGMYSRGQTPEPEIRALSAGMKRSESGAKLAAAMKPIDEGNEEEVDALL